MFKIEKNVPIPKRGADRKGELRLALEQMEIGDSMVVPNYMRQATHQAAKAAKIKIVTKTINKETLEMRVWRTE